MEWHRRNQVDFIITPDQFSALLYTRSCSHTCTQFTTFQEIYRILPINKRHGIQWKLLWSSFPRILKKRNLILHVLETFPFDVSNSCLCVLPSEIFFFRKTKKKKISRCYSFYGSVMRKSITHFSFDKFESRYFPLNGQYSWIENDWCCQFAKNHEH